MTEGAAVAEADDDDGDGDEDDSARAQDERDKGGGRRKRRTAYQSGRREKIGAPDASDVTPDFDVGSSDQDHDKRPHDRTKASYHGRWKRS